MTDKQQAAGDAMANRLRQIVEHLQLSKKYMTSSEAHESVWQQITFTQQLITAWEQAKEQA